MQKAGKSITKNCERIQTRWQAASASRGPRAANMRMDLVEGWGDVDWIGLAQDRDRWRALVNSVLNLLVP
jgi:hypothetical protein